MPGSSLNRALLLFHTGISTDTFKMQILGIGIVIG